MSSSTKKKQQGMTIIEIIVTVAVVSIFIIGFFQSFMVLDSQRIEVAGRAHASDIAYSNLRKVPSRPAQLTQQVCYDNVNKMDLTTGSVTARTGLDLTQYGYSLEPATEVKKALGSNATQSLVAYAPSGCTAFDSNPVEIESTVTYGIRGEKVTHARYIN